jgi:hypothetical protein
MLVIREQQMAAFDDGLLRNWIVQYLKSAYPVQCAGIEAETLDALVRGSVADAKTRRLKDSATVRKYVHVAFLLGRDFPKNPRLDWARRILDDPRFRHEGVRLRALEDATVKYMEGSPKAAIAKG